MTQLVGIANITPDSFSDGGKYFSPDTALQHIYELFEQGASMVDIGAESTRPGATPLEPNEEWARLEPVLTPLVGSGYKFSIDTYHVETVKRAQALLPDIIVNDVTGMQNPQMQQLVVALDLECIVSHLPESAAGNTEAAHRGVLVHDEQQVVDELRRVQQRLIDLGQPNEKIILDPGIGFGKTPELNWQLLTFARHFPDNRVMIGYSRKRFLGENRYADSVNLAAGQSAIAAGAAYLRVHDVLLHMQLLSEPSPNSRQNIS